MLSVTNCNTFVQKPKVLKKSAVIHIVRDKKKQNTKVYGC